MKAQNLQLRLLHLLLFFSQYLVAQSIGVKTVSPSTSLDVNGGVSFREGIALSLSNGVNSNIALADYTLYRITGPTAAFSITGFANGVDGRILMIINATSYSLTLSHLTTSIAANQINAGGADLTLKANGVATLIYNAILSQWLVVGGQGFLSSWTTTGNSGTASSTNFIGTTDNQNLLFKTNNKSNFFTANWGWGGLMSYYANGSVTYPTYYGVMDLWFVTTVDTCFGHVGKLGYDDMYAIYGKSPTSQSGTDGEVHFLVGDDGNEPFIFEQYNSSGPTTTERMRISDNGYLGVNTSSPNVSVDIDGGLALRPSSSTVSLTADNQAVTVGNRSFIVLTSNNTTATNRTFTLSNGLQSGQTLTLLLTTNAAELQDSGNCNLASTYAFTANDMITLMWNGSTWYEVSRAAN